ncbi:hypothetical protein ACOME3_003437 [Neoechinorhynchus agilis]
MSFSPLMFKMLNAKRMLLRSILCRHVYTRTDNPSILMEKLDRSVRIKGKLLITEVERALNAVTSNDSLDSLHALMLIRCTGNVLIDEIPSTRQRLAEQMFKEFRHLLPEPFQLSHLNSFVKIGLENRRPSDTILSPDHLFNE